MITTGSKFFYALAGLLFLTGIVYGYTTGDGSLFGPLTFGYHGSVGDHVGYSILMGAGVAALFTGFATTAFRDGDPEAGADLLGIDAVPAPAVPSGSYWPIVGAFGVGLTVVGVVLNNVFFVAGLIALGAVALEWTIQAWSDRATGDPVVNREIRNRIMLPVEAPVAGFLAIAIVVAGYSRVFLAVSKENAVWIAIGVAAVVFVLGTIISAQPKIRTDLVAGLLVIGAVATIGAGILAANAGEREFHQIGDDGHGEEHSDEDDSHSDDDSHSEDEGDHGDEGEEHGAAVLEEAK